MFQNRKLWCWFLAQVSFLDEIFHFINAKNSYMQSLWSSLSCLVLLMLRISTQIFPLPGSFSSFHSLQQGFFILHGAHALNLFPLRLGHCMCITIIVFLSRRWTACLVYLDISAALCTCDHNKRLIKVPCKMHQCQNSTLDPGTDLLPQVKSSYNS